MRTAKVSRPLVSLCSLHLPCRRMYYSSVAALHGLLLGLRTVGPAGGMGHESMKKTWERRKSCATEKRPMLAEPAKIRHFPLAPIFRRLGARTAHPQGRSASEGRAALAERCAGGLPTEN